MSLIIGEAENMIFDTEIQQVIEYRATNGMGYRSNCSDHLLEKPEITEEGFKRYLNSMDLSGSLGSWKLHEILGHK